MLYPLSYEGGASDLTLEGPRGRSGVTTPDVRPMP